MVGASFSHHAQAGGSWPDGAGMPDPQPQAPPTNSAPEPAHGRRLIQSGRLRWLHRLPLVVSRHATASTVPRVQGQGGPPGQTIQEGSTMTELSVSFAGNLTDDPEVRYTEGGIARARFRVAVSAGGSRAVLLHRDRVA